MHCVKFYLTVWCGKKKSPQITLVQKDRISEGSMYAHKEKIEAVRVKKTQNAK
jgi:hypothetical protein